MIGFVVFIIGLVTFVMKINQNNAAKFKELHQRIENVKDDYVRRDDLDNRLRLIEKGQDKLTVKIDRLLERN